MASQNKPITYMGDSIINPHFHISRRNPPRRVIKSQRLVRVNGLFIKDFISQG